MAMQSAMEGNRPPRLGPRSACSGTIRVLLLTIRASVSSAIVLKSLQAEQFPQQRPPAHEISDVDGCAGFADVPDLIGCSVGGSEIEVFVQDGGDDSEGAQAHDAEEDKFPHEPHLGFHE